MPEWRVERGIGETRFALIDGDDIIEARILPDGIVEAGTRVTARLINTGRNAVATDGDGNQFLLPKGAPGLTEGAAAMIEVTRSTIPGGESWKRPLARIAEGDTLADAIAARPGSLPAAWDDLIEEARSGIVRFAGGELRISPTPAMTLIDVDGHLEPGALALAGAREAAKAVRRLDIGGSIGIDLPTVRDRQARQASDAAIDAVLTPPFERTAVNGFGFVQIVRPRRRASLIELALDRAPFEARDLLRRVAADPPGPRRIVGHPALIAQLERKAEWRDALARRLGGAISLRSDPALPISGGYAEHA